ncbi:Protein of unknown function [Cotesia congregata]|uniref:Uncharacterized protein n=1 Tax=Cotesia congregata TaxID=51543 RepID=A0A8J2EI83_COTCN|nr:Protein of unknown function [Cotesia congregata]
MEVSITKCEEKLINATLEENLRLYGKKLNKARKLILHFRSSWKIMFSIVGTKEGNGECIV